MTAISAEPSRPPPPEGLMQRFIAGDAGALDQIYRQYVVEVEGIVRRFVRLRRPGSSSLGSDEITDLVQEIFLRAFSLGARRAFDPSRPYGPFLGTLARNVLIDRSRRRPGEVPTPDIARLAEELPAPANDSAIDEAALELLARCVRSLLPNLRAVYEHRYVLGWSQQQTCLALGQSRQQVRTLEARLREVLARELGGGNAGRRRPRVARWQRLVQPTRASST